jgi:NADH-quinone oxidoreductase subunit C
MTQGLFFGVAMLAQLLSELSKKFPGMFTTSEFRGNTRILIPANHSDSVYAMLEWLKNSHGFDMLFELAGIDYLHYPNASDRYAVVYGLLNTKTGQRLFIKAHANDPEPELPSVVLLWEGANWLEREVYDMFGIRFIGHPDLRRILLPEEFTSYPLRKDYPLRGYGERHNFAYLTRAES